VTDQLHPFLARLAEAGAIEPPSRPRRAQNGAGHAAPSPAPGDPQAARYAATALDREADIVAGTPEGARNDTLNRAAFRVGQLVAHGWLDEQTALDTLVDAGTGAGLPYTEAERTARSGLDAGMREPRAGVELHPPAPSAAYVVPDGSGAGGVALGGAQESGGSHGVASEAGELATPDDPLSQALARAITGGPWVHDTPDHVPALWGEGDDVLWAEGEPLIITGPTGAGKTTLGTMLVAGRMGLLPSVLGFPVRPGKRVLVLAMDRPRQIQRAMARLLRQFPADVLTERLVVLPGPPPVDVARRPGILLWLAQQFDADTVVLDSLKDAAVKLSEEETGQGLSRAMNMCVVNGIDVLAYHHQTKRSASGQGKPNTLADVYGSSWITAGAGSVILLWGNAGDLVVELCHLKQPAAEVGPLAVGHDHTAGRSFLYDGMSTGDQLLDLLASGPQTAATVASWLWKNTDRAAVVKARRRLERLVDDGIAVRVDGPAPSTRDPGGRIAGREAGQYALARTEGTSIGTPKAQSVLKLDVSAGRTEDTPHFPVDLGTEGTFDRHTEGTLGTNPQVAPKAHRRHTDNTATEGTPSPPLRGRGAGVHAYAREGGNQTSLESHDVEVCARCHQEAERLIPAPHGRRWCPRCAYPTEMFEKEDE
jgi:AAA domain